jgi:hypothetical protein
MGAAGRFPGGENFRDRLAVTLWIALLVFLLDADSFRDNEAGAADGKESWGE